MSMSIWPHSFHKKEPIMVLVLEKKNGATYLKLGMQTQLDSADNMAWVPSDHTSSSLCVRLNMPKMVFLKKMFKNT